MPKKYSGGGSDVGADMFAGAFMDAVVERTFQRLVGSLTNGLAVSGPIQRRGPGRPPGTIAAATRKPSGPRLQRRTVQDIENDLDRVKSLLGTNNEPMGAEQIRTDLNLEKKELPRILKMGLQNGVLTSEGQKRATKYSLLDSPSEEPEKPAHGGKKVGKSGTLVLSRANKKGKKTLEENKDH